MLFRRWFVLPTALAATLLAGCLDRLDTSGPADTFEPADTETPASVPDAPTIGTATRGNAQASVTFTAPASNGGSAITSYTATSSPGGITGTCAASPCTVSTLANGTAYTFTVTATNDVGTSAPSAASNSVTPAPPAPPPAGYSLIPAGSFTMGSPTDELGRNAEEVQHSVTLTRDFYMKTTEVTQGEWKALAGGTNPACFQSTTGTSCTTSNANDNGPVEYVDWYSVIAFTNALSVSQGLAECYTLTGCADPTNGWHDGEHADCTGATFVGLDCTGYRLPTESEWEYAARAETTTATYAGNLSGTITGCTTLQAALDGIAWWCRNSGNRTNLVAQMTANAWGLYDMLGNVWEWTWTWYETYPGAETDPIGPATGDFRVSRGGGWYFDPRYVRAAYRGGSGPTSRNDVVGFRPSRSVVP